MTETKSFDGWLLFGFAAAVLAGPILLAPFGAGYPDLLQRFAIFGIFAIGFNILFGLTGYLSFGHAAFLGIGSYAAVWSMKLATLNALPAILFAMLVAGVASVVIGWISLRRTGIYFSIITLAFAQMSYNLAYSVLTPLTNGETGLQLRLNDPRVLDGPLAEGSQLLVNIFGVDMKTLHETTLLGMQVQFSVGFYVCAVLLILAFWVSMRIFRSPFGMMLRAVKSNQNRMSYTGLDTKPYALAAFVISGCYAGLAGGLLATMDPLAGAERMQWTASGEVVLMTILGGVGTLLGPVLGAGLIKYLENIFSAINKPTMAELFGFLPDGLRDAVVSVLALFTGEGWHLTLGLMFMLIVVFLPGGLMEGAERVLGWIRRRGRAERRTGPAPRPPRPSEGARTMSTILEVQNVNKRFGGLKALDDVNLRVEEGTIHAIIGPNGAGKSTLLNCFVGRLLPDTGTVTFAGASLIGRKPHEINQMGVSRVFQTPEIFQELTVVENVMIPALASRDGAFRLSGWRPLSREAEIRDRALASLEDVGMAEKRGAAASSLSRGDKRRLEMAMCLVQQPKLLLLDEPTAGMSRADTNNTIDLLKRIGAEKNITKVVIEHDMHVVFSLADRISVLAQGHVIVEDAPEHIKGNPKVQEAYLGGAHL